MTTRPTLRMSIAVFAGALLFAACPGTDDDAGPSEAPPEEEAPTAEAASTDQEAPPAEDAPSEEVALPDPTPTIASSQTCHDRNTAGGNSDQDVEVTGLRDGDTVTVTYLDESGGTRESTKGIAIDGRAVVSVPLNSVGETLTLDGVIVDAADPSSQFGFGASAVSGEKSFVVAAESNCTLLEGFDPTAVN